MLALCCQAGLVSKDLVTSKFCTTLGTLVALCRHRILIIVDGLNKRVEMGERGNHGRVFGGHGQTALEVRTMNLK